MLYNKYRQLFYICVLSFIVVLPSAPACRAQPQQEDNLVHVYSMYGWGSYSDSQYLRIFMETLNEIYKDCDEEPAFEHFDNEEDFYEAIKRPGKNILHVGNRVLLAKAALEYGYRPAVTYRAFGMTDFSSCIYVQKDSGFETVADLEGKTVTLADTFFEYSLLRDFLGVSPESFFGDVELAADSSAPAFLFYLEDLDALFTTEQQIALLEFTNNSMVRDLKKLDCSFRYEFLPLMVSPDITDEYVDEKLKAIHVMLDDKKRNRFYSLYRMFDSKVVKTDISQYRNVLDLYEKAIENGWEDDYKSLGE